MMSPRFPNYLTEIKIFCVVKTMINYVNVTRTLKDYMYFRIQYINKFVFNKQKFIANFCIKKEHFQENNDITFNYHLLTILEHYI